MYLRYILYPVKLQPDNNLFCTLCATPHSLQAIVMIYPETHFFTIQYLIHPISVLTINNYWLFCYALPTYFVTYRSSSGRSFTRNIYIYIYIYSWKTWRIWKEVININIYIYKLILYGWLQFTYSPTFHFMFKFLSILIKNNPQKLKPKTTNLMSQKTPTMLLKIPD